MESSTLSRKELYDLFWSTSMSALSKRFAISDNGLRKMCERMNIPLPANVHWIKLQYNKKVMVVPLPEDNSVDQTVELEWRQEGDDRNTMDPVKKLAKQIIVAEDSFNKPDPLIVIARERLKGKESTSFNFPGMLECKGDELDIRVSRPRSWLFRLVERFKV